jgi:DNA-binding transcriptional ArsR family regulator
MEISDAIESLSALAQASRLNIFRLLVRSGSQGMPAGAIAETLRVPSNTLSAHLGILARAKLVTARKDGRSVIYAVDLAGTRELLSFLVEDCCGAAPEQCTPLLDSALKDCCKTQACCAT